MERQLALVTLLADGGYHSGEELAGRLGMSRAAVWKALRKTAVALGLELEAVRGLGYRLRQPLELLDERRMRAALSPDALAHLARLEILPRIDSTNSHLMRAAATGAPSGTLCLAEQQTQGRGRRGRAWISPFGVNLYLSLLWRFSCAPAQLSAVSLAAGVAVAEALRDCGAQDLVVKWPNDLLWQGRKVGGLLLEVAGEAEGPSHLVLGVGVNLWMQAAQATAIDQPWATLREAVGAKPLSRNTVAARILEGLMAALVCYQAQGLAPFLERWAACDGLVGQPVRLLLGQGERIGRYLGIAPDGALRLETGDGLEQHYAGEISLRPLEI